MRIKAVHEEHTIRIRPQVERQNYDVQPKDVNAFEAFVFCVNRAMAEAALCFIAMHK